MRLVQFKTTDGLQLNGLLGGADYYTTIIHVHGKCGNFYENKFIKMMFEMYPRAGINFLSFNNRGTAAFTEAYKDGKTVYIGTAVERFEESLFDIEAAVKFARSFSQRIILQGHSFGCEKIMYYAHCVKNDVELILLSPSDGYKLQEEYIAPETVEEQLVRIKLSYNCSGLEWLATREYGIRTTDLDYHVPIVAEALVGLILGPPFSLIKLGRSWNGPIIENRAYIYIGGKDSMQLDGPQAMADGMRERFTKPTILILPEGRHDLRPTPEEPIGDIIRWIRALSHRR